jgi:hypothetical protein
VSYQSASIGRLFAVRWHETQISDIERLREEFVRAAERAGGTVIYVSIQDASTKPPPERERRALLQLAADMYSRYDALYLVLHAEGFKGSVLRSALAGMMLISKQREKVKVVASIEEVLQTEAGNLGATNSAIRGELARAGILPASSATEV